MENDKKGNIMPESSQHQEVPRKSRNKLITALIIAVPSLVVVILVCLAAFWLHAQFAPADNSSLQRKLETIHGVQKVELHCSNYEFSTTCTAGVIVNTEVTLDDTHKIADVYLANTKNTKFESLKLYFDDNSHISSLIVIDNEAKRDSLLPLFVYAVQHRDIVQKLSGGAYEGSRQGFNEYTLSLQAQASGDKLCSSLSDYVDYTGLMEVELLLNADSSKALSFSRESISLKNFMPLCLSLYAFTQTNSGALNKVSVDKQKVTVILYDKKDSGKQLQVKNDITSLAAVSDYSIDSVEFSSY